MNDYEWPETEDNVGRCRDCKLIRPLKDGVCRGCTTDAVTEWHDEETDGVVELFTDEDFKAMAMEGVQE